MRLVGSEQVMNRPVTVQALGWMALRSPSHIISHMRVIREDDRADISYSHARFGTVKTLIWKHRPISVEMKSVFLTYQEAARRAGVTIYGIGQAVEAGHMRLYLVELPGSARRWRAVDEAEFNLWVANRRPRGPKRKADE